MVFSLQKKLNAMEFKPFDGVNVDGLAALMQKEIKHDPHHAKPVKPLPSRKMDKEVPSSGLLRRTARVGGMSDASGHAGLCKTCR